MPVEVGGMNTLIPLAVAAEMGLPCVDADGMRRAFPQIEMTCFTLGGISASPMSLADEKGNQIAFETTTNQVGERLVRGSAMMLGLANALALYPMTIKQVTSSAIVGSMSYCMESASGCEPSSVNSRRRGMPSSSSPAAAGSVPGRSSTSTGAPQRDSPGAPW